MSSGSLARLSAIARWVNEFAKDLGSTRKPRKSRNTRQSRRNSDFFNSLLSSLKIERPTRARLVNQIKNAVKK